jgi:hypothetical protein
MPLRLHLVAFLALLAAGACSESAPSPGSIDAGSGGTGSGGTHSGGTHSGGTHSGGTGPGDAGAISTSPDAEPDFSVPAGAIRVTTWFPSGETELVASFANAPALRFHREAERIGQCRLMTYEPSSCTPTCAGTDACIDEQCRAHPVRIDRGPIDWEWPGGRQTVSPSEILSYHAIGATSQPGDVIVRVDGLTLSAPNGDAPAPDGDWAAAAAARAAASDISVRWTNPSPGARIRLHMTDCTGSHGGFAAAEIECEGPDTGSLVLPGAFLDRIDAGSWSRGECGSHAFERYRVASLEGDASVRLETVARASFFYRPE